MLDLIRAEGYAAQGCRREEVLFSIPVFPGGVRAVLRADASRPLRDTLSGKPSPQPAWRPRTAGEYYVQCVTGENMNVRSIFWTGVLASVPLGIGARGST